MEKLELTQTGSLRGGLWECSYDPALLGKLRADTVNAGQGDLKGYDCPKCKNRGFMAVGREDGSFFTRDCDCLDIRRCIRQMEQSGLKNSINDLTFEAFRVSNPWQKILKEGAMAYAHAPEGWFMMGGQSGSGKTHLCTAICHKLLMGGTPLFYIPWRDYITRLKTLPFDSQERTAMLEKAKTSPCLYIDDLYKTGRSYEGNDNPTGADISLAFEIINYRYINRLTTVISSEKTPQQLVAIDEATGSRIIELCGKNVYAIGQDQKKNYRLRGVVNL